MEWLNTNQLKIEVPKRPKKITGTRLGAILGANPWNTEFATWCDITKTYVEPFEDTKYTLAGKAIEPKQAEYIAKQYYMDLVSPSDIYGEDYFKKTYGDFFKDEKVFGGMWDYLLREDGETSAVFEMKTTKRAEDWASDIPEYYALQGALYAYLLGVTTVHMVVSFLEEKDYDHPENYVCSPQNTKVISFDINARYPDFKKKLVKAKTWYRDYVLGGISPIFDEKKDEKILAELRKANLNPDTDITTLLLRADELMAKINSLDELKKPLDKELTNIKNQIKEYAISQIDEDHDKAILSSPTTIWTLSKSSSTKVDTEKLKKDKLYEKYSYVEDTYRLTNKAVE